MEVKTAISEIMLNDLYIGASFTQRTLPSIPIGGSISAKGFLLPVLLLVERMNSTKTDSSSVKVPDGANKLWLVCSDVDVLLGAFLSTKDNILLDNVVEEEDGEHIHFLGGNSFSGIKKYRGSNSSDGGNIGDGVKIADEFEDKGVKEHLGSVHGRVEGLVGDVWELWKRDNIVAGQAEKKIDTEQEYILIPFCTTNPLISQGPKDSEKDVGMKPTEMNESGASDKG
ncbi:hypothetical protein Tco_0919318 [Tanacetum coccineum]